MLFSDEKLQLHCSGSHRRISRQVLVCLPFVDRNTILPIADDVFILKVPNKQGILLFVHQMLT